MADMFMVAGFFATFICVAFTVGLAMVVVIEVIAAAIRETIE